MAKMQLYAISMLAQRRTIVHHVATVGAAHNLDEMTGIGYKEALKEFPTLEGWHNISVVVQEISHEFVRNALEGI